MSNPLASLTRPFDSIENPGKTPEDIEFCDKLIKYYSSTFTSRFRNIVIENSPQESLSIEPNPLSPKNANQSIVIFLEKLDKILARVAKNPQYLQNDLHIDSQTNKTQSTIPPIIEKLKILKGKLLEKLLSSSQISFTLWLNILIDNTPTSPSQLQAAIRKWLILTGLSQKSSRTINSLVSQFVQYTEETLEQLAKHRSWLSKSKDTNKSLPLENKNISQFTLNVFKILTQYSTLGHSNQNEKT